MRIRLLTAGALLLALPAFADEMDATCPVSKALQEAYNKGDANSLIALYTPDAIEVGPRGVLSGSDAIKARVEQSIKSDGPNSLRINLQKCVMDGPIRWSTGDWAGPTSGGYWTIIESKSNGNGSFKIKNLTYSVTPPQVR
jgi:hypothetical protein